MRKMPQEIQYVYSKPKQEFPKKFLLAIPLVVASILVLYFILSGSRAPAIEYTYGDDTYAISTVPQGYTGQVGLQYVKSNSQTSLNMARDACANSFFGSWSDAESEVGCFNMQGFSIDFCGRKIIADLAQLCSQIEGTYDCSSTQVYCRV